MIKTSLLASPQPGLVDAMPPRVAGAASARLPAMAWLLALAAALWPHWIWAFRRLADGSDDPLGLVALVVLCCLIVRLAPDLRRTLSPRWCAFAAIATIAATFAQLSAAPALFGLMCAAIAFSAALCAFLPHRVPKLPLIGLALLALPLIASLQFYAGYPLRLATTEISRWLLVAAGETVARSGTALWLAGRLVIVDAPCSGVQMVWMAYFCACTQAGWSGLRDRLFLRRLAGVGAIVLAGNVLRNSVLVLLEARSAPVSEALHEGAGLLVLAGVCAAVLRLVRGGGDASR